MLKNIIIFLIIFYNYVSNANRANKLSGGVRVSANEADRNDFSQASIQYQDHRICSGSIISEDHILTTASCILFETQSSEVFPGNLQVLVGTNDIFNLHGLGTLHNVKFIIWHKNYKPEEFWKNDIAILSLETSIRLTSRCTEAFLRGQRIRSESMLTITNWGNILHRTSNDNRFLKCVHAKVISQTKFIEYFPFYSIDHTTQGCANTIHPTDEFTSGDSGAALVRDDEIVGIASVLDPDKTRLIVFTKILAYTYFIENTMDNYY